MNRRKWITSAILAGGATAMNPLAAKNYWKPFSLLHASGKQKVHFWEHTLATPPDINALKARLLANENPYGPSPAARLAIIESAKGGNRYGHAEAAALRNKLAALEGVDPEYIILAPGSTDLLEKTAITHFHAGGSIVAADPTYMSLIKTSTYFNAELISVPLTEEYAHDLKGMANAIKADTKLVYICNPNNPTGTLTAGKDLLSFCQDVSSKVPVFVDEAYLEFLPPPDRFTMVSAIKQGHNVLVARTFSKIHGMAGLRIGYMVGQPDTLKEIEKLARANMGLNVTAVHGALASLDDLDFQEQSRTKNSACRSFVEQELTQMGIPFIPSQTSFMLFPIPMEGTAFLDKMYSKGVGIRVFELFNSTYCRVSMGTMDEMKLFIDTLKSFWV